MVLDEMQYIYLEIEVEVEMSGVSKLSELADTHSMLYYKKFSITRGTKKVDNDGNRVRNY